MNDGESAASKRVAAAQMIGLLAICGAAMLGGARVEAAGESAAADTETMEAITVTARKRDESLATVPVSITVFTGEALEN